MLSSFSLKNGSSAILSEVAIDRLYNIFRCGASQVNIDAGVYNIWTDPSKGIMLYFQHVSNPSTELTDEEDWQLSYMSRGYEITSIKDNGTIIDMEYEDEMDALLDEIEAFEDIDFIFCTINDFVLDEKMFKNLYKAISKVQVLQETKDHDTIIDTFFEYWEDGVKVGYIFPCILGYCLDEEIVSDEGWDHRGINICNKDFFIAKQQWDFSWACLTIREETRQFPDRKFYFAKYGYVEKEEKKEEEIDLSVLFLDE